jgi:hypothetical protein
MADVHPVDGRSADGIDQGARAVADHASPRELPPFVDTAAGTGSAGRGWAAAGGLRGGVSMTGHARTTSHRGRWTQVDRS